jgi:hypothetical protein|tara:strand:- start:930 stop:1145 length:216 start_codon:yes stop_codon:yes gene_type:complete
MGKIPEKGDLIIIDQLLPEWHWMKIYEGRMGIVTHIREFHYSDNYMVHVYLFDFRDIFYFNGDHVSVLGEG